VEAARRTRTLRHGKPASAELDERCINTIRFLAVDAVQKANSGHPGMPMGAAPIAYVLWDSFLKHNPNNPAWPNRDRFVLSAGHASMLLYALLHLTGYDLPIEQVQQFRQLHSTTPGHPEYQRTPGVEITTGPLGQGFAHAVGMAVAERWMAAHFNRPGHRIVDHYTYVLASDGDMQEGVTSEAASLAGTWRLGRLVCLYDKNGIQIEGPTDAVFTEDVRGRFEAYGWQVLGPIDGSNPSQLESAIRQARSRKAQPSLIVCETVIGYGSPDQGTEKVHGAALGECNVRAAKRALGWPEEPPFCVPGDVRKHLLRASARGAAAEAEWERRMLEYARSFPDLEQQFRSQMRNELPSGWDDGLESLLDSDSKPMPTRGASGKVLNHVARRIPYILGGSADLGSSNKTVLRDEKDFGADSYASRNMHFGVREHAMGAIAGGMALHGGLIPYTGTFLTFSDYMRPPIRLAALMGIRVIYVFSHDSIGLGEDGPTHQPVEQIMNLRAIPNLTCIRPADPHETIQAWRAAIENTAGPTALILTRQKVPCIDHTQCAPADGLLRGAYVLWESDKKTPDIILIGTGSETHIAFEAGRLVAQLGAGSVRVVSLPSWELFDRQPASYRESVLPPEAPVRVAVEAGIRLGWERYVGLRGGVIGLDGYGVSAPWPVLYREFGLTPENVAATALRLLRSAT
jgi:transketolase